MIHKVKNKIQHNFLAKLVALSIATLMWIYVMNDQNPQIEGSYTVQLTRWHAPDKFKIVQSDDNAKIRVKATRSNFINASSDDFKAYVNFDGAVEGDQDLPIVPVTPQGFQVISINPEKTHVNLEPYVNKDFEIDLMVTGEAMDNLSLDEVDPETFFVTLAGPKSNVESIAHVIGYVSLTGRRNDFAIGVPLSAVDEDGKNVPEVILSPDKIMVDVYLKPGVTNKIVPIQADIEGDPQTGFKLGIISVEPVQVEISGSPDIVDNIDSISTEKISITNEYKTVKKNIRLILPEGVTVENPAATVEIKISSAG